MRVPSFLHLLPCLILLLLLPLAVPTAPLLESLCSAQHSRKYVDISAARIEKSSTYEYSLELFDSPFTILKNNSEIILRGNFSRLTLSNRALSRKFEYVGNEMILKIPADHVFSMQKIPDLEIQIIHTATEDSRANSFRYVMLSQLYVASTFTSKIETDLSRYFGPQARDGDVVETAKIIRLIEGFPVSQSLCRCSCIRARQRAFPAGATYFASSKESTNWSDRKIWRG